MAANRPVRESLAADRELLDVSAVAPQLTWSSAISMLTPRPDSAGRSRPGSDDRPSTTPARLPSAAVPSPFAKFWRHPDQRNVHNYVEGTRLKLLSSPRSCISS